MVPLPIGKTNGCSILKSLVKWKQTPRTNILHEKKNKYMASEVEVLP